MEESPQNIESQTHPDRDLGVYNGNRSKKMYRIVGILFVLVVFLSLLSIPYYLNQNAQCKVEATNCPTKGWHFGNSLFQMLYARLTYNSGGALEESYLSRHSPNPTPTDKTANWKTYKNTKVGFMIKYPSGQYPFVVRGPEGGNAYTADGGEDNTVIQFPQFPDKGRNLAVSFELELLPYTGTFDNSPQIPDAKRMFFYNLNKTIRMDKSFNIAGKPSIWFKENDEQTQHIMYHVYYVANNHAFIFHATYETTEQELEQILSTFRFGEPNRWLDD